MHLQEFDRLWALCHAVVFLRSGSWACCSGVCQRKAPRHQTIPRRDIRRNVQSEREGERAEKCPLGVRLIIQTDMTLDQVSALQSTHKSDVVSLPSQQLITGCAKSKASANYAIGISSHVFRTGSIHWSRL